MCVSIVSFLFLVIDAISYSAAKKATSSKGSKSNPDDDAEFSDSEIVVKSPGTKYVYPTLNINSFLYLFSMLDKL